MPKPTTPTLNTAHTLYPNVLALWPITENTGTTLTDLVGGKNLTTNGTWSTGAEGPQQNFNGSQNAISNASDLFSAAQLVRGTLLMWAYSAASQSGKNIFSNEGWIGMEQNGTSGRAFSDGNPTYANGSTSIADGTPHQLVYTWDNTPSLAGKFYTDGVAQGTCTPTNAPLLDATSRVLTLASQFNSTNHWTGSIIYVALFNIALTPSQITTEYSNPWALITPASSASGLLLARRRAALSC